MIKKLYRINGQPHFEEIGNDRPSDEFIEEREFSDDEINFGVFEGSNLVIDATKKEVSETVIEEKRITDIKIKAGEIIIAKYSDTKQRNMLARFQELIEIKVDGDTLSEIEQTEYTALKTIWAWIKAVRIVSNESELTTILAKDITWPQ